MSAQHTIGTIHRETVLEQHLVERLVADHGYVERTSNDYDRASAMDRLLVLSFVEKRNPTSG